MAVLHRAVSLQFCGAVPRPTVSPVVYTGPVVAAPGAPVPYLLPVAPPSLAPAAKVCTAPPTLLLSACCGLPGALAAVPKPAGPPPLRTPRAAVARGLSSPSCDRRQEAVPQEAGGGGAIHIDGWTFERLRELGRGSFGVVWEVRQGGAAAAREEAAGILAEAPPAAATLALKWSTPGRQEMLEACLLEAQVLKQLAELLPEDLVAAQRVPRHVAHGIVPSSVVGPMGTATAGFNHVLLAMSKLEGRPLDQWLYGVDEQVLKTISMDQLLHGPLEGSQLGSRDLKGACGASVALLVQLAPVFATLEGIAVHRDLSAHNFLVRPGNGGAESEQFAVLDFGLAVRARNWQTEWQLRNIAGDPRYFAPAAWMLLAFGHKYIEAHPDPHFRRQYRDRIDHFAVGVLSAEVLFTLWNCPRAELGGRVQREGAVLAGRDAVSAGAEIALRHARAAWHAYWAEAMGLFQHFHAEGATAIRQALAGSQAIPHLVNKLRALCLALRAAAELQPADSTVAALLRITAGLLDWRSGWPSWREVPALLGSTMAAEQPATVRSTSTVGVMPPGAARNTIRRASFAGSACLPSRASAAGPMHGSPRLVQRMVSQHSHRRVQTELPSAVEDRHDASIYPPRSSKASDEQAATPERAGGASSDGVKTPTSPWVDSAKFEEGLRFDVTSDPALRGSLASAQVYSPKKTMTPQSRPRLNHRRMWTVDEAVSLRRGVHQVETETPSAFGLRP